MAVKEKQADSAEEIEWNVENEIQLFFAMNGHKPVGEKLSCFLLTEFLVIEVMLRLRILFM
jgi:hypothetical protein